jgi:hypothetical protein
MEINLAPKRLILLAIGLIVLWLIGGFTPPEGADGMVVSGRVMKAWLYCHVGFIAGAVCVSIIDHMVGTLDRSNIRFAYVVLGILMMAGTGIALRVVEGNARAAAVEEEGRGMREEG